MPSFSSVLRKEDCRTTWERIRDSLLALQVSELSFMEVRTCISKTTGLDFQPGTSFTDILKRMEKHKYISVDFESERIHINGEK